MIHATRSIEKKICPSLEAGERITTNLFAGFVHAKKSIKAMAGEWEYALS